MSYSSFWEQDNLTFKQLPTVQDLLTCCDDKRFVEVVLSERVCRAFGGEALSPKRRRRVERRLLATLTVMRNLPIRKKSNRTKVLIPQEAFVLHVGSGLIERSVSARLVSLDDAPFVERTLNVMEGDASLQGNVQSEGEPPWLASYALASWEDTLACRVWLRGGWCCRERYLVLSSAFWEMTYYGFEYDRVVANQARAKAARAACSCGKNSPSPTTDGPGIQGDNARSALSFGLVEPDRFEGAYQERLALCVAELNRGAQLEFLHRFSSLAHQLGAP